MKSQWKRFKGRYYLLLLVVFFALILYAYLRFTGLRSFRQQGGSREPENSVSFPDRPVSLLQTPQAGADRLLDQSKVGVPQSNAASNDDVTTQSWQDVHRIRQERMRDVCSKDDMIYLQFFGKVGSNRKRGKILECHTKMCPVIVDNKHALFYCFIPKVASTAFKNFFLKLANISINSSMWDNSTAFHLEANNALHRVSPAYFPQTTLRRFYKALFVRHPFDRLVSAFKDKGEKSKEEVPYFYTYWDPLMKARRGEENVTTTSKPTFSEFVWYLLHTYVGKYDAHWAPYWRRCQPCHVDYDFIGKLETAHHDFAYFFQQVGQEEAGAFIKGIDKDRETTIKYFSQIPASDIMRLYNIYRLDFEIFGYTLDGILPTNATNTGV